MFGQDGNRNGRLGLWPLCLAVGILLLLQSCAGRKSEEPSKGEASMKPGMVKDEPLTVEEARSALITMAEHETRSPKSELPALRSSQAKVIGEQLVAFGPWVCDLGKKTWDLNVGHPGVGFPASTFEGVFYRTAAGHWEAKMTAGWYSD